MWWLAWAALAWAQVPPSDQTVIYYNARMALREGNPVEAAKLWFLRTAVLDQTGRLSPHDADFHSVTWAALGSLGICQDGYPKDKDGAGLWPIALHNWVVLNRTRQRWPKPPSPFRSFDVGRQQRLVSIHDVLSAEELRTLSLARGKCARARLALYRAGMGPRAKLADREVSARLLRDLLERAKDTLARERVRGLAAIDARLFDIDLQLAELAAREARRDMRQRAARGRAGGLSRASVTALREDADPVALDPTSEAARILREAVSWPTEEWMALSANRRRFVFDYAALQEAPREELDHVALGIIDALVANGDGAEVMRWIPRFAPEQPAPEALWADGRGQRLLGLSNETGFTERAPIALQRAVRHLEQGELPEALRTFAFAVNQAPDSATADEVRGLALRWLSYVAAQFELTDELLVTLRELVPRREYGVILEDLMWGSALRADARSFRRGLDHQLERSALSRRMALLEPLARGNVDRFQVGLRRGLSQSPSETLRFLDQLVDRLALEDSDIRNAHTQTLERVRRLLEPLADPEGRSSTRRRVERVRDRARAILEGLTPPEEVLRSDEDAAKTLNPSRPVYAGSLRVAPTDPLPWPFKAGRTAAPQVFSVLELIPVEWRTPDGTLVFGWSLQG